MKAEIINPYITWGYLSPDYYCDRQERQSFHFPQWRIHLKTGFEKVVDKIEN